MAEKRTLSARGVVVDFDLMKIKEQMSAIPKAVTVTAREDFIDRKSSRRLKRQIQQVVTQTTNESTKDNVILEDDELDTDETLIQEGLKILTPETKDKKDK